MPQSATSLVLSKVLEAEGMPSCDPEKWSEHAGVSHKKMICLLRFVEDSLDVSIYIYIILFTTFWMIVYNVALVSYDIILDTVRQYYNIRLYLSTLLEYYIWYSDVLFYRYSGFEKYFIHPLLLKESHSLLGCNGMPLPPKTARIFGRIMTSQWFVFQGEFETENLVFNENIPWVSCRFPLHQSIERPTCHKMS